MRNEDLVPEFVWQCNHLRLTKDERQFVRQVEALINDEHAEKYYNGEWQDEDVNEDLTKLFDILDAHSPPFTYFGASEGDGSDYGVWVSDEALRNAQDEGELAKGEELPNAFKAKRPYFLVVNDHGNMTLYRRAGNRWIEEWSVV